MCTNLRALSSNGRALHFELESAPNLSQKTFAVRDPSATQQDGSAVTVGLSITPPGATAYAPGTFGRGSVGFAKAALDPNSDLAFTIETDALAPAGDMQQEYAIYCGNSDELHGGTWLNFHRMVSL